jgi:DNA-directed RNA polymerase specialized sigma24 family protein
MTQPTELMTRYCEGDAAAFRALYALVAPRLLSYLRKLAKDQSLAADLLQQTFLKLHAARAAYVRGADPIPWLFSIAHHAFLDEMRKRSRTIGAAIGAGSGSSAASFCTCTATLPTALMWGSFTAAWSSRGWRS